MKNRNRYVHNIEFNRIYCVRFNAIDISASHLCDARFYWPHIKHSHSKHRVSNLFNGIEWKSILMCSSVKRNRIGWSAGWLAAGWGPATQHTKSKLFKLHKIANVFYGGNDDGDGSGGDTYLVSIAAHRFYQFLFGGWKWRRPSMKEKKRFA